MIDFWGRENHFHEWIIISLSPRSKLSDVKKTYIDIGNGQKFELKVEQKMCLFTLYSPLNYFIGI